MAAAPTVADVAQTWHLPRRPSWDCACCQQPWPCAPAKVDMAEEFVDNRISLVLYLSGQMTDAVNDYLATKQPMPPDLYDRFLGWAA